MMSQNRQSAKDRLKADLNYELDLKQEKILESLKIMIEDFYQKSNEHLNLYYQKDKELLNEIKILLEKHLHYLNQ